MAPVTRFLGILLLFVLTAMAGCVGDDASERPLDDLDVPGVLTERGTRLVDLSEWPADAMAIEVEVTCACSGQPVLAGWTFAANWTPEPSAADAPQQTSARDRADVDLYAVMVLRERNEPRPSPVAHVDVLRSGIVGIGVPGTYTTMVGTGLAPSTEVSLPSGATGMASASLAQEFPLEIEMDGNPLRFLFIATNGTGYRLTPEYSATFEVPQSANVTLRAGTMRAFAFDEPLLEQTAGLAADHNFPASANARVFGTSSMTLDATGELLYTFMPWIGQGGVQDATYRIQAPDHDYRVRFNHTDGQGGYQCLDGCGGLGGTYAVDSGIAPPGPTRFTVEGATCASDSGCRGIMVGVDMGTLDFYPLGDG